MRLLLADGADVTIKDRQRETALHIAAGNSADSVRLLLSAGADVTLKD